MLNYRIIGFAASPDGRALDQHPAIAFMNLPLIGMLFLWLTC